MRFDKLTYKAQEALAEAQSLAESRNQQELMPEHLLLALLGQTEGVVRPVLQKLEVSPDALSKEVETAIERLPKVQGVTGIYMSPALKQVLDKAFGEASQLKDEFVSSEHILLALTDDANRNEGLQILKSKGVTRERLLGALSQIRGSHRVTDQNPEAKYQALENYGRDLTPLAPPGKLEPVIGRDQ